MIKWSGYFGTASTILSLAIWLHKRRYTSKNIAWRQIFIQSTHRVSVKKQNEWEDTGACTSRLPKLLAVTLLLSAEVGLWCIGRRNLERLIRWITSVFQRQENGFAERAAGRSIEVPDKDSRLKAWQRERVRQRADNSTDLLPLGKMIFKKVKKERKKEPLHCFFLPSFRLLKPDSESDMKLSRLGSTCTQVQTTRENSPHFSIKQSWAYRQSQPETQRAIATPPTKLGSATLAECN